MIWLIGAGQMAIDYASVLTAQCVDFEVIGRGVKSAQEFKEKTSKSVNVGGLELFLNTHSYPATEAIVAVGVEQLCDTTLKLLAHGVKRILLEKPGGLDAKEIQKVCNESKRLGAEVYIAYNRRFYSSVKKAKEIIEEDGGVTSFNFELTEWGHVIANIFKDSRVKENWFLANTTHITDLAFYLGGKPEEISCFTVGSTDWHKRSTIFSGAGRTKGNALFSYQGNWESPGRWSVEIITNKHRLIFRPLEKLQIQNIGNISKEFVEIDDELDILYKPGLYKQVESFLTNRINLCSVSEQWEFVKIYNQMANYEEN